MAPDPCLLCLSATSGDEGGQRASTLLKLVTVDDVTDDVALFLCIDCAQLLDSATMISNSISQLQIKLRDKIDGIRQKILSSEAKFGDSELNGDISRVRKTFLECSVNKDNEPEEIVQVKMEMESNYLADNEQGASSPSAFMFEPEPNFELEFEDAEPLEVKAEVDDEDEIENKEKSKVVQKRKAKPKTTNKSLRRSSRATKNDEKPEVIKKSVKRSQSKTKEPKFKTRKLSPKDNISPNKKQKLEKPAKSTEKIMHSCTICFKKYASRNIMFRHRFIKHETKDKHFFCTKCPKSFTIEANHQRHVEMHRFDKDKPMVCEICDARCSNQETLDRHVVTCHERFPCKHCSKNFISNSALVRHLRIHTGEKPYKCDICAECFANFQTRAIHIEKVHEVGVKHGCNLCDAEFSTRAGLKFHMYRHEAKGCFDISCDLCNEKFKSKDALNAHQVKAHGKDPFVCEECGAKYTTMPGLTKHKLLGHAGIKKYKCDICDLAFGTTWILNNHKRTHTNERPFICSFCGAAFKTKKGMKDHEKKLHTTDYEKDYNLRCSICDKRFQYKSVMDKHIQQVHSGEKPFICSLENCGRSFAIKYALTQHLKVHGIFPKSPSERAPRTKRDSFASSSSASRGHNRKTNNETDSNSSSYSDEMAPRYQSQGNFSGNLDFSGSAFIPF